MNGLNIARREAEKSNYIYRVGAVLLKKGRVVSRGFNCLAYRSDLKRVGYYSIHAEVSCLLRAKCDGDTIVVVRVLRNGNLTCAKPCDKCLLYAEHAGVRKIYYSDWDGTVGFVKL